MQAWARNVIFLRNIFFDAAQLKYRTDTTPDCLQLSFILLYLKRAALFLFLKILLELWRF